MSQTPTRPMQTTLAGSLVVSASLFIVFSLFSSIGNLRSLESRRMWEEALAEPGVGSLGLGIEGVLTGLYVLSLITAACAAATTVLGVFVLRGHRQARVALGVVTVPLFLAGFLTGGLLVAVVAAAVVWLWLQPSRDWFAGKAPADSTPDRKRDLDPPSGPPPGPPAAEDQSVPRGEGRPVDLGKGRPVDLGKDRSRTEAPAPWGRPMSPDQPSAARPFSGYGEPGGATDTLTRSPHGTAFVARTGAEQRRPVSVVLACASTWVLSSLVAVFAAISIVAVAIDPDTLLQQVLAQDPQLADQGVTTGLLVSATVVLGGVLIAWAVAAAALAAFAFRGANGARIGLIVSAVLAGVPSLLAGPFVPLLLPVGVAAVVTVVALLRSDARHWYAARATRRS